MSKTENVEQYLKSLKKANHEEKINEYYAGIHDRISSLDINLNEIVHRHEKDFLSAFRTLMGQVQKELQKLRDLSDEQALMVKRETWARSMGRSGSCTARVEGLKSDRSVSPTTVGCS